MNLVAIATTTSFVAFLATKLMCRPDDVFRCYESGHLSLNFFRTKLATHRVSSSKHISDEFFVVQSLKFCSEYIHHNYFLQIFLWWDCCIIPSFSGRFKTLYHSVLILLYIFWLEISTSTNILRKIHVNCANWLKFFEW